MLRALIALLALAFACPAAAADFLATPATFAAVRDKAQPGDRILLTAGAGEKLSLPRWWAAPGVTIEPAPGADPLITFSITGRNVILRGFRLGSWNTVNGAIGVLIDGVRMDGNRETNAGLGIQVTKSTDVTIRNSHFNHLAWAIQHNTNIGFTVEDSTFEAMPRDVIRPGYASKGVTLRRLKVSGVISDGTAHRDAIQFWTSGTPTRDVLIEDVEILRGETGGAQGVFMGDEGKVGYDNVVIRRVAAMGPANHCIAVQGVRSGAITDNFCQAVPGQGAWITIPSTIPAEVTVARNWSSGNGATTARFTQIPTAGAWNDYTQLARWKAQFVVAPTPPPVPKTVEQRLDALEAAVAQLLAR